MRTFFSKMRKSFLDISPAWYIVSLFQFPIANKQIAQAEISISHKVHLLILFNLENEGYFLIFFLHNAANCDMI